MSSPRVAVVGGGLAGSLCALVLRSRGATPTIFDAGRRRIGGRLAGGFAPDSGAQFLRVTEGSPLTPVVHMLADEGLIAPWQGRFGILGGRGGFLPLSTVSTAGLKGVGVGEAGDFCGFLSGASTPMYVGKPDNGGVCEGICRAAGIDVRRGGRVSGVRFTDSGWTLEGVESDDAYDALVVATHDAALAAGVVRMLAVDELAAESDAAERLTGLAQLLQQQREEHTRPLFTLSATFAPDALGAALPFDAVSAPNSPFIQLIVREASKPGREREVCAPGADGIAGELFSAVSTPSFAADAVARTKAAGMSDADEAAAAAEALSAGMRQLLSPLFGGDARDVPAPLHATAKRWGAALPSQTLGLSEDCLSFEPWRLAIAGDFIASHASPLESAALSGLEAGERVAQFFAPEG